jgi:hypothetical protein
MHRMKKAAAAVFALALVSTACKKNETPAADTTSVSTMPEPAPAALRVSGVETGKGINADKTVKDDEHDFGVRDTIYISVKTEGAGSGTLASKVTFQDGQTVDESSQSIAPAGDEHHEFHIAKASAWPKGDYKVKISLNGDSVGAKDFTIK